MKTMNLNLEEKSRAELIREYEILWQLAALEIDLKKHNQDLEYHNSLPAEGFRKVIIAQIEQKIENVKLQIEGVVSSLENLNLA